MIPKPWLITPGRTARRAEAEAMEAFIFEAIVKSEWWVKD